MLSAFISFPGSSAGKEFTCSAGDPISIPRSGRSAGEGIGYPLQYSWASLGAQLIKNLPSMWETWVQSRGWEDPLEKGAATHFSILVWRSLWIEGRASRLQSMGFLQVRILEWVAFHFSRGSSQFRDPTQVSHIADGFFTV